MSPDPFVYFQLSRFSFGSQMFPFPFLRLVFVFSLPAGRKPSLSRHSVHNFIHLFVYASRLMLNNLRLLSLLSVCESELTAGLRWKEAKVVSSPLTSICLCSLAPPPPPPSHLKKLAHFFQVTLQVSVETSVSHLIPSCFLCSLTLYLCLTPANQGLSVHLSVWQVETGHICRQVIDSGCTSGAEESTWEIDKTGGQKFWLKVRFIVPSGPLQCLKGKMVLFRKDVRTLSLHKSMRGPSGVEGDGC